MSLLSPEAGGEITKQTSVTELHDCEQAVMAAAKEERAAHAALQRGIKPLHPSWTESDESAYQDRLARWQAASRILVDALNRAGGRGASVRD
jgi:uncharacterized protein YukE